MNQEELQSLVTRLLDSKAITSKEAIELLKLSLPEKTNTIYVPSYIPSYWSWGYPYFTTTHNTSSFTNDTSTHN